VGTGFSLDRDQSIEIRELLASRTSFSELCAKHAGRMLFGFPQARTDIRQLAKRLL